MHLQTDATLIAMSLELIGWGIKSLQNFQKGIALLIYGGL